MSESLLLPAAVAFLGALVVVWWERPKPPAWGPRAEAAAEAGAEAVAGVPVPAGGPVAGHGSHAAAAPVDAVPHGTHVAPLAVPGDAVPANPASTSAATTEGDPGEGHHGVHAAPATD